MAGSAAKFVLQQERKKSANTGEENGSLRVKEALKKRLEGGNGTEVWWEMAICMDVIFGFFNSCLATELGKPSMTKEGR